MKYDKNELAAMAVRNYLEATKECAGKCAGPDAGVDCVAKVFAAPLEVLERVEQENAALRKDLETKRFALESVISNNGDVASSLPALKAAMPGHPFLGN